MLEVDDVVLDELVVVGVVEVELEFPWHFLDLALER